MNTDNVRLPLVCIEIVKHRRPTLSTGRVDRIADLLILNTLHRQMHSPCCVSISYPLSCTWVASQEDIQIPQIVNGQWMGSKRMPIPKRANSRSQVVIREDECRKVIVPVLSVDEGLQYVYGAIQLSSNSLRAKRRWLLSTV